MTELLEIEALAVRVRDVRAVHDASLVVREGEAVALLDPTVQAR